MEQPVPVKEVKILETAEDIQERREQVNIFIKSNFNWHYYFSMLELQNINIHDLLLRCDNVTS